jgi:hypothetical protein
LVLALALVGSSDATIWTGAVSSAWSNNSNWNPAEPNAFDDTYLDGAGIDPVITENGEEAAWLEIAGGGALSIDGGTLMVGDWFVLGAEGLGTAALTVTGGTITVTGDRLSIGTGADATLNIYEGQIEVLGDSGIKNPDLEDTAVINLHGGIIDCTSYEAKWQGSVVFYASPNSPHGGLLLVDGDQTQTSGGSYSHEFIGQMIIDGWINTNIGGDQVVAEYDTIEYPAKTVVKSITDVGGYNYAWGAYPVNRAEEVPADVNLTWRGPAGATYDVYFGTNAANLPLMATGNSGDIYDPGVMDVGITYFWKVDTNVGGEISPGPLWWFKAGEPGEVLVWTGSGADDLWRTPENWDDGNVPGPADDALITPPPFRGPVIDSNCYVRVMAMYGPRYDSNSNQVMDINGGTVLVEWEAWEWAYYGDGTGTINITGTPNITIGGDWWRGAEYGTGILNISGDPNIIVRADWRGGDKPGSVYVVNMSGGSVSCERFTLGDEGSCELNMSGGTIDIANDMRLTCSKIGSTTDVNMTSGLISVGGALQAPDETGGTLTINLNGGTIDCNEFTHEGTQWSMDITEGTLIIDDNVTAAIDANVAAGRITAYDGNGGVKVEYSAGQNKTIVTGVHVKAWNPNPPNDAQGVSAHIVLSWSPGEYAASHDVYLDTNPWVVFQRDPSVYKGRQDANSYDPPGELDFGQSYYWTIDEISSPNGWTWPGPVWVFTVHDTYYVDANATGANNGLSWTDAFNYLQDALAVAQEADHIWVAEGVYKPDANTAEPNGSGDRQATFQLKNGMAIYGGFAGGETKLSQRDWEAHETILSGDIGTPDVSTDNSYHVVTGSGTDPNAVLDGFTITAGNANGTGEDENGAGMHNNSGSPTVVNCTFSRNSAADVGGGMYNGRDVE